VKHLGKLVPAIAAAGVIAWLAGAYLPFGAGSFSDAEIGLIRSLSLSSLPPLPPDPSNAVADDPRAARLGQQLFFDTRLSGNGAVACATCHQPERRFTDGLPRGRAIGLVRRNTPSIIGTAYSPWQYWDGRRDSQWAQALTPLEDPLEHGGDRLSHVRLLASDPSYRRQYEALFGPLPEVTDDRFPARASPLGDDQSRSAWSRMAESERQLVNAAFANIGKALAAYERRLMPGRSRFDDYADALASAGPGAADALLSDAELRGLELFIGEARCIECHNGPLLTNNEFHNTGQLSIPGQLPDRGRIVGVRQVLADPFNCRGAYSDDPDRNCAELDFVRTTIETLGATRTPSLRNLGGTAPFQSKGQLATLADVIDHYDRAPLAMIGHNEAEPLNLNRSERRWLEAFLETLQANPATPAEWLAPPADAMAGR